ncbi:MAG: ketoacyl-ACP synthase III, partial [Candidatus Aureabacteria bacterium]|nr:ketoacyl-ACP synthase III [Candidatus Auribacterota bacterium]
HQVDGLRHPELFDLWVKQVCGVERRVFFSKEDQIEPNTPTEFTEYMGTLAGRNALKKANIDPESIDCVIFSSFTPSKLIPNAGCTTAHFLGTKGAAAYHINTACSGFVDGLGLAQGLIRAKMYKRIMVIASETMSVNMNFDDVTTAILFADGACAAILEETPDSGGVLSYVSMTSYNREMLDMDLGKAIRMAGGPYVQRNAVNGMYGALEKAVLKAGIKLEDIQYVFPHQANLRILQAFADKLHLPHERMLQTVTSTGNTSSSAVGIGLDMAFDGKLKPFDLKKDDIIAVTAVGGGYTFCTLLYRI